jgi:hypothetical protein
MKKVLLAIAVVAFFASCSKDYTCTRTSGTSVNVTTYTSVSKSNANYLKAQCERTITEGTLTLAGGVWDKK